MQNTVVENIKIIFNFRRIYSLIFFSPVFEQKVFLYTQSLLLSIESGCIEKKRLDPKKRPGADAPGRLLINFHARFSYYAANRKAFAVASRISSGVKGLAR